LAKLDIFRCWQAAGKPVVVTCPKEEVPELVRQLDPRGLLLCPCGVRTPDEAQSLFDLVDG
jgi:protein-L-isoaspartate O-methyltransferase